MEFSYELSLNQLPFKICVQIINADTVALNIYPVEPRETFFYSI